jgi:hypothetical protein
MVDSSTRLRRGLWTLALCALLIAGYFGLGRADGWRESAREERAHLAVASRTYKRGEGPRSTAGARGHVLDDGGPVADARVCCAAIVPRMASSDGVHCASTDRNGYYVLADIPPGLCSLSASADGYALTVHDAGAEVIMVRDLVRELDFHLRRDGERVSGVVVDGTGGVVPHARVQIVRPDSDRRIATILEAAEDGAFSALVDRGPVLLTASADGYAATAKRVLAPATRVQLTLIPSATIQGVALNALTGQPMEDVEVQAVGRQINLAGSPAASTNEDGEFSMDGLTPGTYSLVAQSDSGRGAMAGEVELAPGQTVRDVEVLLQAAVSIDGRVESEGGEPCAVGIATLGPPNPSNALLREGSSVSKASNHVPELLAKIGANGAVHFRGAVAGIYQATVQCRDHVVIGGPVDVEVGETPVRGLRWSWS